jgi:hypothetical protein
MGWLESNGVDTSFCAHRFSMGLHLHPREKRALLNCINEPLRTWNGGYEKDVHTLPVYLSLTVSFGLNKKNRPPSSLHDIEIAFIPFQMYLTSSIDTVYQHYIEAP